jgi:hypothetical protein
MQLGAESRDKRVEYEDPVSLVPPNTVYPKVTEIQYSISVMYALEFIEYDAEISTNYWYISTFRADVLVLYTLDMTAFSAYFSAFFSANL